MRVGLTCIKHHSTFTTNPKWLTARSHGTLFIASTAIIPELHRMGFGSIWKSWQIAYARMHGFSEIVTNVRKSNVASLRLNQKFGFIVMKEVRNSYPDGETALVLQYRV